MSESVPKIPTVKSKSPKKNPKVIILVNISPFEHPIEAREEDQDKKKLKRSIRQVQ